MSTLQAGLKHHQNIALNIVRNILRNQKPCSLTFDNTSFSGPLHRGYLLNGMLLHENLYSLALNPPIFGGILFSCMCVMWPITDTATNPHVSVAGIIVARVSSFILVLINILLRSVFLQKTLSTGLCLKVEVYFRMLGILSSIGEFST